MVCIILRTCIVVGLSFAVLACEQLTLKQEPTTIAGITTTGYPDIQAIINESLDDALLVVTNSAARNALPDHGYTTLQSVLRRARDGNLATARALDLDRASLAELTDAEMKEIEALAKRDPELKAKLVKVLEDIHAKFARLPTVEVTEQPLDDDGNDEGPPYVIASENGFINLGYSILTTEEFLLIAQAEQSKPERGFAIGSDWEHRTFGSGHPWGSDRVRYYFTSSLTDGQKSWMGQAMEHMHDGTGIVFSESTYPYWWLEFWHTLNASRFLRISKEQLSGEDPTGWATVGKVGKSRLVMDSDYVTDEKYFNHEMGHVLGLLHEHQRYDQDNYVRVGPSGSNYDKIPRLSRRPFLFWSWYVEHSTTLATPYDYHSIMLYRSGMTLRNRLPWTVDYQNNAVWGDENGDTWFSPWDIYTIRRLYRKSPNPRPDFSPASEYPPLDE